MNCDLRCSELQRVGPGVGSHQCPVGSAFRERLQACGCTWVLHLPWSLIIIMCWILSDSYNERAVYVKGYTILYSIFLICGFVYNLYLSECGQRPRTSWRFWTEPRSRTSRPRRRFPTSGATSPKISAKLFKHPDFSWIMQFWHCDNFDTVLQQVLIVDCLPCDSTAATIYLISTSLLFSSPSCILMMILYLSI